VQSYAEVGTVSQLVDWTANGMPEPLASEALKVVAGEHAPVGYLTTTYLAALWDERCRQVDLHRQDHPDDIRELELRQRRATRALQAYRFLAELEQQLGLELALPVLGPRPGQIDPGSGGFGAALG
jgi:hypothetical protein